MVGPAALVLAALFLAPLGLVTAQSFGYDYGGFTLTYWQHVLTDPEFLAATALSLRVALVSTLAAMALGLGLALALQGAGRLAALLARVPLVVPHLVVGYVVLLS